MGDLADFHSRKDGKSRFDDRRDGSICSPVPQVAIDLSRLTPRVVSQSTEELCETVQCDPLNGLHIRSVMSLLVWELARRRNYDGLDPTFLAFRMKVPQVQRIFFDLTNR